MAADEWWRDAVVYQVYPRSFADSDGDGIGDLRGVVDRLDHVERLGADAIWLSPFYPSPQVDFGYDISDYESVDPEYGTLDDFDDLVAEAGRRGLRIVVDLVMNHTSDEHAWFVESRSDRSNPKRDWYIWADPRPGGGPPNNWLSSFEKCGAAWTFDDRTGQYYLHSFTAGQPDLNWRNPDVRAAMGKVWRFWLDRGVAGFRIDVAHRLMKDPDLRDNPPEVAHARRHFSHPVVRQRNLDLPETHDVLRELREVLDGYGDRFALGEVPISDDARLAEYFGGDGMQTAFHIAFWEQPWDASAFRACVDGLAGRMRPGSLPTYALATHDISRTVSRYGAARAGVAAMMMLTLRGVACVYYGEEIGMSDAPPDEARDVDGRDGQRTPMQWDDTGGFTTGEPWLPMAPGHGEVNVGRQLDDPDSLLSLYRRVIAYRRGSEDLRRGGYRSLDTPPGVFAYLRGENLLVALNFTGRPASFTVPGHTEGRVELSTRTDRTGVVPLRLEPDEGLVLRLGPVR
ncbi:alpha-amylase family glycosyl hydrolase [Umezawaea sp. NPDC059074]|uniref:alpha-amylase family glycosyl hydrolase n=1 Tax=Umezawaea sp. NPDC059074 TaxID=3346716 RepID=UPI0036A03777